MTIGNQEKRGLFITIDANIGAGKTNACHAITSAAVSSGWNARVLEEPTHHPKFNHFLQRYYTCLLYTSPSPRDQRGSRMPSSA